MNLLKQYKKLQRLNVKAEQCLSRKEAKEVLRKANKAQCKIDFASYYGSTYKR
jgi:inorganic pyrophosphatase